MKKTWNVNVNGTVHTVEYKAGFGAKVLVNGQTYKVKSQNWFINMIDYPIQIDDAQLHVVAIGNKVDLAVNGIYLGSGEDYKPLDKMPSFVNVFIGISCIGGLLLNGVLSMCIGILFSALYVKQGLKQNTKGVVGAFVGCTLIQLVLFVAVVISQLAA